VTQATRPSGSPGPTVAASLLAGSLAVGTAVGWMILPRSHAANTGIMLLIWANVMITLIALGVEARRRPYSLHLMHLVSMFLFLGAASLFQYSVGAFAVAGSIQNSGRQVLPAVMSVTLWLIGYLIAYEIQQRTVGRLRGPMVQYLKRPTSSLRTMIVLFFALLSLGYLAAAGLAGASTRGTAEHALGDFTLQAGAGSYTIAYYLIHHVLLRAFSLVALLTGLLFLVRGRNRNPVFIFLVMAVGAGTMYANNPFAAARMWLATSAIGFAAPFVLHRLRTGWAVVLIALAGLALLPALHESRYAETFDEFIEYAAFVSPLDYLATNSDVDSLGMLTLCQRWTESHGHRWGMQFLGSLLFWFPRTLWPNKPIETGAMVTGDLGFEFTNLAPPIMSDPLVDFGYVGIPFVAALFGLLFSRLDRIYWSEARSKSVVRVIDCIYPLWMGCIIFMTRGGSFGSFSFTAGFTVWIVPLAIGFAPALRRMEQQEGAAPERDADTAPP
jgi:hypothetical protein